MKKIFTTLAVAFCTILATAQTNQYFWLNGNLMFGNAIVQTDSLTFSDIADIDTLHLFLPRTIVKTIYDTITITETVHDTVYVNNCDPESQLPEGALHGEFSVSPTKKVRFSKGNLQYNYGTNKWQFAGNQYAIVGNANVTNITNKTGIIDLFGWGDIGDSSTPKVFKTSTTSSDYIWTEDWGTAAAADFGAGWFTLSHEEWVYLFQTRSKASSLFGQAKIGDVTGLVVLPDEDTWTLPAGLNFTAGSNKHFTDNIYTTSEWEKMEAAGAIFLPAAGYRSSNGSYISYISIVGVGDHGNYWSSSEGSFPNYAWDVGFGDGFLYAETNFMRNCGLPVRLTIVLTD